MRISGASGPSVGATVPQWYPFALGEHHESTVATPVKGLGSGLAACFLLFLEDQDQVPARKRDPLVLQLDTFGETIGRIPVLRGPRLHVL